RDFDACLAGVVDDAQAAPEIFVGARWLLGPIVSVRRVVEAQHARVEPSGFAVEKCVDVLDRRERPLRRRLCRLWRPVEAATPRRETQANDLEIDEAVPRRAEHVRPAP